MKKIKLELKTKKNKKNTQQFVETVLSIDTNKLNASDSPHHKKDIWILNCSEKTIVLLPELLENKNFFQMILDNKVVGQKFAFEILKKGRYLINARQI